MTVVAFTATKTTTTITKVSSLSASEILNRNYHDIFCSDRCFSADIRARSKALSSVSSSSSRLHMSIEAPEQKGMPTTTEVVKNKNFKFVRKDGKVSNKNNKNRNGRKKNNNRARSDPIFLRKRTTNLLHVTSYDYKPPEEQVATQHHYLHQHQGGKSGGMKVDKKTFHFLIDAWAFSNEQDAEDHALSLLHRMEDLMDTEHPLYHRKIFPDVRSYTKVINAISRSAHKKVDAPELAESLLNQMNDMVQIQGNDAVKPNTHTYTSVIEAYANSNSPGCAHRAEQLCEIMVQQYLQSNATNTDLQPTTRAFNAAINAYAKSGEEDAAQCAEKLFNRMEELYESGISSIKPDSYTYNNLITAWANHCVHEQQQQNNNYDYQDNQNDGYDDDAPGTATHQNIGAKQAKEVLQRMEYLHSQGDNDYKPTIVSYNAVLDAYAKSGDDDAAEKAESLLKKMEDMYQTKGEENAKPNVRSFNTVINVWAKSRDENAPNRAQDMLDHMTKLFESGSKDIRPDVHSFCTVINAWAKSGKSWKADRALNIYREMKSLYESGNHPNLRPNIVVVNAVMNACAFTDKNSDVAEQNRAMEIAHTILKEAESDPKYFKADQVTYGTFLKVCANQMPDTNTRQQIVAMIFKKCCNAGQVGNLVLHELQELCSSQLYFELTEKHIHENVSMESMPREWWCNVVEGKWRRRRNL